MCPVVHEWGAEAACMWEKSVGVLSMSSLEIILKKMGTEIIPFLLIFSDLRATGFEFFIEIFLIYTLTGTQGFRVYNIGQEVAQLDNP